MGRKIPGHQNCLICHPDLDKRARKRGCFKGLKRHKVSDARRLQESIDDLFDEIDLEKTLVDAFFEFF